MSTKQKYFKSIPKWIYKGMVIHRWVLDELVGYGGFSWVFKAHDIMDESFIVALKIYKPNIVHEDPKIFYREIEVVKKLKEKCREAAVNLRRIIDYGLYQFIDPNSGENSKTYYIVFNYLEYNLKEYVERIHAKETINVDDIINYWYKIVAVIACAHKYGVIHRDIKPTNILFDEDGNIYVTDFNTCRIVKPSIWRDTLRKTGSIGGYYTPGWAAPEQLEGGEICEATDVYLLGRLLYYMIYGAVPDVSKPPVREYIGRKMWIKNVIYKCLERDVEKRYSNAIELLEMIGKYIYPYINLKINIVDSDGKPLKATINIPGVLTVKNRSKIDLKIKPGKYNIITSYRGTIDKRTINIRGGEINREITIKMPISLEKEKLIREIEEIQNKLQKMKFQYI